ncbi:MAG: penicillin-binding transpeptidase domain-containing protein [Planctomycetota bacterium]|jgi:penicillin-binding protein 2|nr:penicillin-binding transpeptidase domain-containing protein [Planctomycetota bacterium]
MIRLRIHLLIAMIGLCFVVLLSRLFYLQILSGADYVDEAFSRIQRSIPIDPLRGAILDRHGEVLARNEPGFDLMVIPARVTPESRARVLQRMDIEEKDFELGMDEVRKVISREVRREIRYRYRERTLSVQKRVSRRLERQLRGRSWLLFPDLDNELFRKEIFIDKDQFPGFEIRARPIRRYPAGSTLCHVIGSMSKIFKEEYEKFRDRGYFLNDLIGRGGLEGLHEELLKGHRGLRVVERDSRGVIQKHLFYEPPADGHDLRLSIDLGIQQCSENALDEGLADARRRAQRLGTTPPGGGSVVVLSVPDGHVLAIASSPRFGISERRRRYTEMLEDPLHPLIHRPVGGYRVPPPGSVFKILTGIAGLETGKIDKLSTYHCRGYMHRPGVFKCLGRHGDISLIRAIEKSCNVYFYHLGEELGPTVLSSWARAAGFGERTGIDLPGELAGLVPDPAWKKEVYGKTWFPADSRYLAIGQGALETTPLQVARFMVAVASDGRLPIPKLVHDSVPETGLRLAMRPENLRLIRESMFRVVESGTARRSGLSSVRAAGKTGSAELGGGQETHAWFAGYAPVDNPKVAFAVLLENSGHGGDVAAPVAAKILRGIRDKFAGWK